jgi:hypothetical protein
MDWSTLDSFCKKFLNQNRLCSDILSTYTDRSARCVNNGENVGSSNQLSISCWTFTIWSWNKLFSKSKKTGKSKFNGETVKNMEEGLKWKECSTVINKNCVRHVIKDFVFDSTMNLNWIWTRDLTRNRKKNT